MSEFLEAKTTEEQLEYEHLTRSRREENMGFREGLFESKSVAVQNGFDSGYSLYSRYSLLFAYANSFGEFLDAAKSRHLASLVRMAKSEVDSLASDPCVLAQAIELMDHFINGLCTSLYSTENASKIEPKNEEIELENHSVELLNHLKALILYLNTANTE